MTINEAISRIDHFKANGYGTSDKIYWLSTVEGIIKKEIIDTHEGGEDIAFNGYGEDTPTDTVLIVPEPYSELYLRYIEAQIDYANADYGKYNNSAVAFDTALEAYARYYNNIHMPKKNKRFIF